MADRETVLDDDRPGSSDSNLPGKGTPAQDHRELLWYSKRMCAIILATGNFINTQSSCCATSSIGGLGQFARLLFQPGA